MESFGKFLSKKGLLTKAELEEATQALVVVGGRLGTNAVELGYLEIEDLDGYLSEHRGVPNPPADWLAAPCREALAAVPAAIGLRHLILPLAIENRCLHVAMADPFDPSCVDEVAFASGLRVKAYILSESHLSFLRERHMGIERAGRFAHIAPISPDFRRKRRSAKSELDPAALAAEAEARAHAEAEARAHAEAEAEAQAETLRQRKAFRIEPLNEREELIDQETFSSLHEALRETDTDGAPLAGADAPAGKLLGSLEAARADELLGSLEAAKPLSPPDVARLEQQLQTAAERAQITSLALRLARTYASAAALFVVHRGSIRGSDAVGEGITDHIDAVFLPVDSESVFAAVAAGTAAFRGEPPRRGIDRELFKALGRSGVKEVAILPVRIGKRVLNLLYVDNGSSPLGESSLAALDALCADVSAAYERLILARKQRHC